jgi:lysozyme
MATDNRPRIAVAALSLSAAGLVGLASYEGWAPEAMIPVRGDVPTVGFGSTTRADGSPVQIGDKTTPVKALQRTLAYTQKADAQIKRCLTAPLHQEEYDEMADFGYQYGVPTLCRSQIVAKANAGDYAGSCEAYLSYRFIHAGKPNQYDCSTLVNGKPNKVCWGVWSRQLERRNKCMAAQ